MRRRGRPPRAESHLAAAAGGGGPSGSGVGNGNGNDEHSRSSSQRAVGRGRPRREGQQQQQEVMAAAAAEAEAEVVAPAAARRGRPPLLKASREVELQVMLRRELRLKPTELRPPPASWKQMRDGAAPETLRARVVALREALGLEVVRRMVQRCPHLLHWHEATLLSKLDDLTLGLGLSRQELLGAVLAYPRLLQSAPDTVLARVALLQAELRLPLKLATTMVAAQPPLVCMAPSTLRMRADLLHEAASLLPQWRRELSDMAPGTLGRMLRCSEAVLNRLVYTYLRVSTNGRKFHEIRSMKTITTIPAAQWRDKNPLYQEWLDNGARDRASGALVRWDGWWRGPHAHVQGQGKDQAGGGATLPLPPGDGGGPADWWGMPSGGLRWSRAAAQLAQPHTHLHPQPGPQAEEPKLGPASSSGRNGGLGSSPSMGSSGWPGGSYDAPPGSLGARGSSGVSGLAFGEGGLHLGNSELWQRYSDLGGGGDGKRWTPPDSDPSGLGGTAARADGSDSDDSDEDMGPEAGGRSERRA
ncbi:hypothetical protein HXX76_010989 [Chlamydomonas incerta]|uniref:Mitochondrial transcription termination factor n=1 Tax=Chlamydomonas incerta TaxID=51695 RepID=A0A835SLI7_CHLIN|nr:hypothetical protein HXX76_010989 [Chlamydomonas incerta]|eukprot:KAG2429219.1 hypothetical protein HXX76_010989 [Chlamydomonas incerta]